MRKKSVFINAMLAVLTISLAGCDGGGGGGGGGGGQAAQQVASRGVITALGSIVANGITYDITNAVVNPGGTTLQPGMVVTVKGTFANITTQTRATASSITFSDNVQGPVDSVNGFNNALTVMGQPVRVTPAGTLPNKTEFVAFANITSLKPGNLVQVSGLTNSSDGFIEATRIELVSAAVAPAAQIEIKGTTSSLDLDGMTFKIGPLTVDYSLINPVSLPAPMTDGLFVQVTGAGADYTTSAAPSLIASGVAKLSQGLTAANGTFVSVEGFVSGLSGTSFMVEGIAVNSGTVSLADIANASKVRVKGTFSNAVLNAAQITLL